MSIDTIVSMVVGGFITWLASWIYYHKAGGDLEAVARAIVAQNDQLRRSVNVLGQALEIAKLAEGSWDADGNLIGLAHRVSAGTRLVLQDKATGSPAPGAEPRLDGPSGEDS
jgi:hypothetical protein